MTEIEHFFTPVSGYAYLGHDALLRLAGEFGAHVRQRPVDIARVFAEGGSTPPAKQSDTRRAYRATDIARWAAARALPVNAKPRFWPTDGAPAARTIISVDRMNGPVDLMAGATLAACWARDLDIASPDSLSLLLRECGLDPQVVMQVAAEPETQATFEANTQAAIDAGIFGSPTYRLAGEIFFGQDRLDFVRHALERAS